MEEHHKPWHNLAPKGLARHLLLTAAFIASGCILPGILGKAEAGPGQGSISGTIELYRTRVRTEGHKSDKDVVVYLESVTGTKPSPAPKIVAMDQKGLIFLPHVLPVQTGTTVEFLNSDSVEHNVYFLSEATGETLDLGTWPQGVSVKHTFTREDVVIILCKLHLEMAAYVVIVDNPYFTTASIDGDTQKASFNITSIPPGQYRLKIWHKKLHLREGPQEVEIVGGSETRSHLVITKKKYAK